MGSDLFVVVDLKGLEPSTLRMRTVRSPKLSYKPTFEIYQNIITKDF